jgi:pimeloyl-ACP methyl ester carboxylesterase
VPGLSTPIEVEDPEPTSIPGNGLRAHWYKPGRENARTQRGIVCLPIQGGDYEISTLFARYFASLGYHTLRFERRAEWLDPDLPVQELASLVPRFVADVSRVLDAWLARDGAPPAAGLGLFGVSMGAMTGTMVAASDDRIQAQIFCIGGGGLDEILIRGRDAELDEWRDRVSTSLGGRAEFERVARESVGSIDLLGSASRISPERTLFVGARFDRVVPWSASVRLWEALHRPRRIVLPTGHYSAVVALPWIKRASKRHFDRWLDA